MSDTNTVELEPALKEIAEKLRFSDEYYFSRFFQRLNGSPPLRYRSMFQMQRGSK